jgi:hypothetical protein
MLSYTVLDLSELIMFMTNLAFTASRFIACISPLVNYYAQMIFIAVS